MESLLCVLEAVQGGVKGLVVDEKGNPVSQARLETDWSGERPRLWQEDLKD